MRKSQFLYVHHRCCRTTSILHHPARQVAVATDVAHSNEDADAGSVADNDKGNNCDGTDDCNVVGDGSTRKVHLLHLFSIN